MTQRLALGLLLKVLLGARVQRPHYQSLAAKFERVIPESELPHSLLGERGSTERCKVIVGCIAAAKAPSRAHLFRVASSAFPRPRLLMKTHWSIGMAKSRIE